MVPPNCINSRKRGRQSKSGSQRLTYSTLFDQIEWGNWMEQQPALVFITEGPQKTIPTKTYYDNFRLIDTGEGVMNTAQVTPETK